MHRQDNLRGRLPMDMCAHHPIIIATGAAAAATYIHTDTLTHTHTVAERVAINEMKRE